MIYSENILLCIAIPLVLSLVFLRGSALRFTLSFVVGMFVCLLAAYISGYMGFIEGMTSVETAIYISPVVEEAMKLLPALFYLYVFTPDEEEILVCAVALGAGFATFENCCYLLATGSESLQFTLVRGFAVGVMHVVSMVAVSFGLSLVRRFHVPSTAGVMGALSVPTTFHALYNLLVSDPGLPSRIGFALPLGMAALLFIPYRKMLPLR